MDRIYLINLERSTDRLEHFKKEMKRCNLPEDKVQIFKAIDGNTHVFTDEEEKMVGKMNVNNRVKACLLSHYYVLKDIEKNGYKTCLVLEDDVRFVTDVMERLDHLINHLDMNWYVCYIGLHTISSGCYFVDFPIESEYETTFCSEKLNDYVCRYKKDLEPTTLAFLVNGTNVSCMLEEMRKNPTAADHCYINILKRLDAFYGSLCVLATGNSKLETTIHTKVDIEAMTSSYLSYIGD